MNKLSLTQQIQRFLKLESAGGILLLFSAVVAMLLANSPLNQTYNDFLNLPVSIQVGTFCDCCSLDDRSCLDSRVKGRWFIV